MTEDEQRIAAVEMAISAVVAAMGLRKAPASDAILAGAELAVVEVMSEAPADDLRLAKERIVGGVAEAVGRDEHEVTVRFAAAGLIEEAERRWRIAHGVKWPP